MTDLKEAHPERAHGKRAPSEPVARLASVTKRYGEVLAVNDLDLEIRRGEVLALLGPNGAGKTTTVNVLLGLTRPTSGEARLFGHRPDALAARRRAGAMLQISGVPATLTVREHVELVASYYPAPLPLDETLALAGLADLADRRFGRLSGGQKQRVLFALAIAGDPDLLFLDEPTVGLDVESRRGLWQCIRRLVEHGRTVLLTTHYLQEAEELATRVVLLREGRVVAEGTPAEIKARAAGRQIRCRSWIAVEEVESWPGVDAAVRHGHTLEILSGRAEDVVRELLARDAELADLEVLSAGLEEAFIHLTRSQDPLEEIAA